MSCRSEENTSSWTVGRGEATSCSVHGKRTFFLVVSRRRANVPEILLPFVSVILDKLKIIKFYTVVQFNLSIIAFMTSLQKRFLQK